MWYVWLWCACGCVRVVKNNRYRSIIARREGGWEGMDEEEQEEKEADEVCVCCHVQTFLFSYSLLFTDLIGISIEFVVDFVTFSLIHLNIPLPTSPHPVFFVSRR